MSGSQVYLKIDPALARRCRALQTLSAGKAFPGFTRPLFQDDPVFPCEFRYVPAKTAAFILMSISLAPLRLLNKATRHLGHSVRTAPSAPLYAVILCPQLGQYSRTAVSRSLSFIIPFRQKVSRPALLFRFRPNYNTNICSCQWEKDKYFQFFWEGERRARRWQRGKDCGKRVGNKDKGQSRATEEGIARLFGEGTDAL